MGNLKKWKALVLSLCMVISVLLGGTTEVYADNAYSNKELILLSSEMTIYTNQTSQQKLVLRTTSSSTEQKVDGEMLNKKILNDLVCTSSDKSVVGFDTGNEITGKIKPKGLRIPMMGVSEGTATITVKSKLLNQTLKFKVTVKDAELACEDAVYYTGNKYTFAMKGNAKGVSYSSSNKSVAVINKKTGVVRAKIAGTTTSACVAQNGKTYT